MSNPLNTVGPRLELLGHQLRFYGQSIRWSPRALVRYRKEVFAVLADATFGSYRQLTQDSRFRFKLPLVAG